MLKKLFIVFAVIIGIVVLVVAALFISSWTSRPKTDKKFLSQLKGEVVFTRRNAEGVSDIWKINANGTGEVMLFHNDSNPFKADALSPLWSKDGKKIYFISFDNNKKEIILEIDDNEKNINIIKNPDRKPSTGSEWSREKDIRVFNGDIYIIKDGQEVRIFKHSGYYNQDYVAGSGASEASWSPDKEYIIFEVEGFITIINKNGKITKLTKGSAPDWKY